MAPAATKKDGFVMSYVLSCAAATISETVTYPLDLTKTRLQIQGEHVHSARSIGSVVQSQKHRGMLKTAIGIAQEEGVLRLWQGVSPAVVRHYVYSGFRIGVYEHLREHIFHKNPDGSFPAWKAIVSGGLGGVIAQFLASPTDLVKVQMQMEGKRRLQGLPPRVTNMWQAFRYVLAHGGIKGLWKGWIPNCQRAALVNVADLATYDKAKHWLLRKTNLKDDWVTHSLAAACAGLAAAIVSTPTDVIKTRIMNQPHDAAGHNLLYKGSIDCLMKTVQKEGFLALYKGFIPTWARMIPPRSRTLMILGKERMAYIVPSNDPRP